MNKQIQRWKISDVCYKHRDRNGEWMLAEEGVKLQEKIQKLTLAVSFLILISEGSELTEHDKLVISMIKADI